MEVTGPSSIQRAFPVKPAQTTSQGQPAQRARLEMPKDEVEISSVGKMLENLNQSPEIRAERLAQIKAEIADGTYDTDAKMSVALDRLMASLQSDE
jgi:flagellar biosynthesis anti-sigma factor FlgM